MKSSSIDLNLDFYEITPQALSVYANPDGMAIAIGSSDRTVRR